MGRHDSRGSRDWGKRLARTSEGNGHLNALTETMYALEVMLLKQLTTTYNGTMPLRKKKAMLRRSSGISPRSPGRSLLRAGGPLEARAGLRVRKVREGRASGDQPVSRPGRLPSGFYALHHRPPSARISPRPCETSSGVTRYSREISFTSAASRAPCIMIAIGLPSCILSYAIPELFTRSVPLS